MEIPKDKQLEIGKRIRAERKKRELTQDKLAEAVGITPKHLGNIESGKSNPSFMLMKEIAEFMNISLDVFLDPVPEITKSSIEEMTRLYISCSEDAQRLMLATVRAFAEEWHDITKEKELDI